MTGDFSEIYQKLIGVLGADATLTALLGDSTQIYQDWPDLAPKWPALILKLTNTRPSPELDGIGLWWPTLQINILGLDPVVQRGIESRLITLIDVPRTNRTEFTTTNFTISQLFPLDSQEAGSIQWANTDQQVKNLATLWRVRVQAKSG